MQIRILLVKNVLRAFGVLPLPVIHSLGWLLGWTLVLVPNRLCRDTETNIKLCLPELDKAGQRRLIRNSLVETGKAMLETGALWFRPGVRALQLIRRIEGHGLVQAALEKGRGVILATPHLGAWEAAGLYGAAEYNMTCLYRPLRIPELEGLVRTARNRLGANYVPATPGGIRSLCKTLEQGSTIAMLPDQEPQSGAGMFAAFFNSPAWTMTLHFSAAPDQVCSSDLKEATHAMNRAIEELVRLCPSQYQWGYRRFRTRQDGKQAIYYSKS
jgi:KDO2-lipid IV(A) lauroyltransferase